MACKYYTNLPQIIAHHNLRVVPMVPMQTVLDKLSPMVLYYKVCVLSESLGVYSLEV